jgi:hypothetical protein
MLDDLTTRSERSSQTGRWTPAVRIDGDGGCLDRLHGSDAVKEGSRMSGGAELLELDRRECLAALAGGVIGRVVFTDQAMPAVQPVNYVLDGEEILFRTANGSKLAAAVRHAVVGFQIDEFDPESRLGWTVLGVGEAYEVHDPGRLAELSGLLPDPWVAGHDAHVISIPLQLVSGRRLRPAPQ